MLLAPPEVPVAARIVPMERFVVGPVQYRNMCSPVANFFTATGQQFSKKLCAQTLTCFRWFTSHAASPIGMKTAPSIGSNI
jgi:hypothetical protein